MHQCPYCHSTERQVKSGFNRTGSQCLQCQSCRRQYTPRPNPLGYYDGISYLQELFAPLIDNRLLIAYNDSFDCRALAAECARHKQRSTERGWRCAMQLVKRVVGTKKNLTLSEACALYKVEAGNHRADRDVLETWRLLMSLARP